MSVLLTVLLSFVWNAVVQGDLNKLGDGYRAGTELTTEEINNHPGLHNHFLFFKSLEHSDVDVGFGVKFLYHNFLLKPTRCNKGTKNTDRTKCVFRNDRPMIDCVTCYKTYNDVIEETPKPYIHCVHKPTLTKEIMSVRSEHCEKMSYSSGSASVLLVQGKE